VDECEPLLLGLAGEADEGGLQINPGVGGRGFSSSTSQLNLSRFGH